ncbi:MAG: cell division/cell wall cluster transcriptional repressor MraZ [Rickettsiaceae bacterium]|nr:cell division/cell wall cluster transcriptional repressor MraZ [Rickettsiaceae bacterium]
MFLSKYVNNIDKKGRVSVPAGYRLVLSGQSGIIAYPSIKHQCIEACGVDRLEALSLIIQNLDPYSEERDAFETVILGESSQLAIDSEGRIIIPKSLMEYANLSDQVCFIGKGLVFEIWNPAAAEEHLAKARVVAQNNRNLLKNI